MAKQEKVPKTKQDYGTPWEFVRALEKRFGPFVHDLAAHAENAKCSSYYTKEQNALAQPWAEHFPRGNLFLNPEYADIAPWAEKCLDEGRERQGFIIMLTPASVATQWFADFVSGRAYAEGIYPRLQFEGMPVNPKTGKVDGYPKDLMITLFGCGIVGFGAPWGWK